jgi:hypothetical protein
MLATCMYMQHLDLFLQHPDKTFATFVRNRWNIWNIHLKHTCIAITTCATSRSTFATSIYNTCNISRKHLKHLKHTIATCAFSVASACCLDEWRLVDAELDAGMELEAAEWRGVRRCGAHRQHEPLQGQADGAWPWRETRVWKWPNERLARRARLAQHGRAVGVRAGRRGRGRGSSLEQSERATWQGQRGRVRGPSVRTDGV